MAMGIKDKVAIIGMGCTHFGERWDVGAEELMVEAFTECLEDAGIDRNEIQAAWLGTCIEEINVGKSGLPLSTTLRLPLIPVTRTENFCASGTESFRGAVYAVASGAYDLCLAMGVVQIGVGLALFTMGSRHVPAAELALLSMTEVILAPLWVWFGMGEVPTATTLLGGLVVLGAIAGRALTGLRRKPPPFGAV